MANYKDSKDEVKTEKPAAKESNAKKEHDAKYPQPNPNDRQRLIPVDTSEKRMYQVGDDPAVKVPLTKSEAEGRGLYWLDAKPGDKGAPGEKPVKKE